MVMLLLGVIYLSFISLGLPDALLGAAWPSIYPLFGVSVSWAGVISMIISLGTITSSLLSDRLTRRLGAGKITAVSVGMTALALLGFSRCSAFWQMCLWAIPYGLGAGSVDAALNNYVALHYASRHMSWLHCMWGIGAAAGPYIMGYALTGGHGWSAGYRYVGLLQLGLTVLLVLSLPLWKKEASGENSASGRGLRIGQILRIPGAAQILIAFFCYCAREQTAGLWASSYLVLAHGISSQSAAGYASLFYAGITVGRLISGFLTIRLDDRRMIHLGEAILALGVAALLLPLGKSGALAGLVLVGLGCAPIYPCIIHSTPVHFGAENSQALIGLQMACAYTGSLLMPPLFGLLTRFVSAALLPVFLGVILLLMVWMYQLLLKRTAVRS